DALPRLVLAPFDAELLLEVRLVLLPQRVVVRRRELAEGALPDVVDVRVLGARDAVSARAHAHREVVVLEHADPIRLVERTHGVEDLTSGGDAVHRGDADVEDPAPVLRGAAGRKSRERNCIDSAADRIAGLDARL